MALIGIAPPYPKYRGHMTAIDLAAEDIALGRFRSMSRGHGLTRDMVYRFVRPNADPDDPFRSLVYASRFGPGMADLKADEMWKLDPPNCQDEFGC